MNFFNSLRIKRSLEEYYHYSKNDPKFGNLITLIDNNLGYSVFQAIENTKIGLSKQETSRFQYSNRGIEIDEMISIRAYNEVISKDILKISRYLDGFLQQKGIEIGTIDTLFLTGGSSLVKAVREMFKEKLPHSKINTGDNFYQCSKWSGL